MTMEQNIRARLAGNSGVYSLVGGQAAPRIFPETRAQDSSLPCIVFSTNNEEAMMSLSGEKARKADLEVVAVAVSKASAIAVADAVIACLDGYSGTGGGTTVNHSLHSRSVTAYQAPEGGETTGVFLHTTVFSVMYQ
jgi:hypothetical protein